MSRKLTILTLTTLALGLLASVALARPYGGFGPGSCPGFGGGYGGYNAAPQTLSAEDQEKAKAIVNKYEAELAKTREQLAAKQTELSALAGNTNADPERIRTLAEETAKLRTELFNERVAMQNELDAALGDTAFSGQGYGPGSCPGAAYGGRGFGRGYGPGSCPGAGYGSRGWR